MTRGAGRVAAPALASARSRSWAGSRFQLKTGRKLAELEPPPADADRIERWLGLVQRGVRRAIRAGRWLTKGNLDRAARLIEQANRLFAKGRRQVRSIDFEVCT